MNTLELLANKIQSILGNGYAIIPFAKLQTNYTEAQEVNDGNNQGYINRYNDEFTKLTKNKTIGIITPSSQTRANTDYYYLTMNYAIQFRVATNTTITKLIATRDGNDEGQEIVKEGQITFFDDIENLIGEIVNKTIQLGDYRCKMTIGEPIFRGKEFDGELEYAIFEVSGIAVIGDKQTFGADTKIEFFVDGEYVELDDVNSYNEMLDGNGTLIVKDGKVEGEQNLAQSGWVATCSIDDIITDNKARIKIYELIHENKSEIGSSGNEAPKKYKLRTRITSKHGNVHVFNALVSITYNSTKNGVPGYNISLTDDNKGIDNYILSFDSDGGSEVESITVKDLLELGELPTPEKAGYDFDGWTIDGKEIDEDSIYTYEIDKTAVAQWEVKHIKITFDNQDATTPGTKSTIATYFEAMPEIEIPSKIEEKTDGTIDRDFLGYYTDVDGKGIKYYNSNGTSARNCDLDEDTTLYAYWEPLFNYQGLDEDGNFTDVTEDIVAYQIGSGIIQEDVQGLRLQYKTIKKIKTSKYYNDKPVIRIGAYAFQNSSLEEAEVTSNITEIYNYAFSTSENLQSIILPENLENIRYQAFRNCNNLKIITIYSITPPINSGFIPDTIEHIYVPAESVDAYKTAQDWSDYADKISAIEE